MLNNMKRPTPVKCSQLRRSLLPAMAALAVSAVTSTGSATSGADSPRHDKSAGSRESAPVGPDYYSSNDNPFHSD